MAWQSRYKVVKLTAPVWLLWGGGFAALMLLIAHGFEIIGHLPPCELCLHQREGYWAALLVGLGGYALARWKPKVGRGLLVLLAAVLALETVLAAYHAGVEWKWWPGPASCTGVHSGAITAAQMSFLLSGPKVHVVQCDQAAWRLLGLSMAGWNALCALALTVATVVAYRRVRAPR
jgi:disulfide bond formation protein DsbB